MFRDENGGYIERVDVIGNKKFIEVFDDLEKIEDLGLESFEVGKDKLHITSIIPQPGERGAYDIGLPRIRPTLMRKRTLGEDIAALDVMAFDVRPLPIRPDDPTKVASSTKGATSILRPPKPLAHSWTSKIPPSSRP